MSASLLNCPAPAKLNLFLHVTGRRADGYHLLQTAFQLIDRSDFLDFRVREDGLIKRLNDIPGVSCPTPGGAFYAYPSVKGVLGQTIRGQRSHTSAELATLILDEAEVAVVPGEAFGTNGYLRLSYALSDDELVEGVTRIGNLLAEAN